MVHFKSLNTVQQPRAMCRLKALSWLHNTLNRHFRHQENTQDFRHNRRVQVCIFFVNYFCMFLAHYYGL